LSENPRPDGSLGLLYLAGVLRDSGYGVSILDMCVGDEGDELSDTFYRRVPIDDEHIRVGMPVEAMLGKVADCQIVGVTSSAEYEICDSDNDQHQGAARGIALQPPVGLPVDKPQGRN
jgi:hypothetical protein